MADDNKTGLFRSIAKTVSEVKKTVADSYGASQLKIKVDDGLTKTKHYLDEKGITEKASVASEKVGDVLDTVSGTKQLELVEERLALQTQYNNILAAKLEEALQRIEALEKLNK